MKDELYGLVEKLASAEHVFSKHAKIFNAGERVIHVHIVKSGEAHLIRKNNNLLIKRYTERNIIAEASLFNENYHCSCMAATRLETLSLPKKELLDHLRQNSELAFLWMEYLSDEIVRQRSHMSILGMKTVHERFEAFRQLDPHADINMTQVARSIGVSKEALYRELAKENKG
jgi:CRP-like cAMP-binding protein